MLEELKETVRRHTDRLGTDNGVLSTGLPGVSIVRAFRPSELTHSIYKPLACVILQGCKMVTAGNRTLHFASGDTLIVAAETPTVSQITQASPKQPYLALVVELDPATIGDLMKQVPAFPPQHRHTVQANPIDAEVLDTFWRMTRLLDRPASVPALLTAYTRELHYWLLLGKHGYAVSQYASDYGTSKGIGHVLKILKERFTEPLSMRELASAAGMSASSFHEQFREATSLTPLQFQKQLRLVEAKRLMLSGEANASGAAFQVGYESINQFTREYHRMFGASPARDNRQRQNLYPESANELQRHVSEAH